MSTQPGNNEAAKPPQPVSREVGDLLRVRSFYDKSAHSYDRWLAAYGRVTRIDGRRDRLLSRARGRVLGVGVGTGRNLAAYPIDAQITGVDVSPAMLQFAATRASELGRAAAYPRDVWWMLAFMRLFILVPRSVARDREATTSASRACAAGLGLSAMARPSST